MNEIEINLCFSIFTYKSGSTFCPLGEAFHRVHGWRVGPPRVAWHRAMASTRYLPHLGRRLPPLGSHSHSAPTRSSFFLLLTATPRHPAAPLVIHDHCPLPRRLSCPLLQEHSPAWKGSPFPINISLLAHTHTQHTHTHTHTHTHIQTDRQTDRYTHTQYIYSQTECYCKIYILF